MNNNVLIFEPNPYHYEVLPGFIKYFMDLNYDIDVLMQRHALLGNEMCLCNFDINIIYYDNDEYMKSLEKQMKKVKYKILFCSSFDVMRNGETIGIYEDICKISNTDLGIIGCYHSLKNLRINGDERLVADQRVVTLSDEIVDGKQCVTVNPHYFGKIPITEKVRENRTITCVGTKNDTGEIINGVQQILKKNLKINIIFIGKYQKIKGRIKNFLRVFPTYVKHVNSERIKVQSVMNLKKISSCCTHLGKLNFEDMYEVISQSDFLLFNPRGNSIGEYLKGQTSGTKQLALGFGKPCIMRRDVALAFGLSKENSILYDEGELGQALEKAILMSPQEYTEMCRKMQSFANEVYDMSLKNLNEMLENLERKKYGQK